MSIMSDGTAAPESGEQQTQQTQQTPPQSGEQQTQQTQQTPPQGGEQQTQQQTPPTGGEWLPEAYRNDPAFGKFKTIDDLCKSQKHLQGLLGKKTVARPDENSTEDEWTQWWRDNGVPDDGKEYELTSVKDMPADWFKDEIVAPYREAFKKAHVSAESAKLLWEARNEYLKNQAEEHVRRLAAQRESAAAAFRKEWGDKYAANMNKAAAAFGKLFPGVDIAKCRLCDDPDFIRGMLRAYDAVKDDTMPAADAPVASALSAVEERISAIMNNPAYHNAQNPDHARLVQEIVDLQRRKAELKSRVK